MRVLNQIGSTMFCWCISTIGWERMIGSMARKLSDADSEDSRARPRRDSGASRASARAGFPKETLEEEFAEQFRFFSVDQLEARLAEEQMTGRNQSAALAQHCRCANHQPDPVRFRRSR